MKTITRNTDNVSLYLGDAIELHADRAVSQSGSVDFNTTDSNATLQEGGTPPGDWTAGAYACTSGVWTRTAAGETAAAVALAQSKADKNDEINAARLAANLTTFPYGGKLIACDTLSRSDIDGTNGFVLAFSTLPPGWPNGWKAVDNTYVPIPDVATWKQFYAAMVGQGLVNFAHAQALKAQLTAATTPEAVAAIAW